MGSPSRFDCLRQREVTTVFRSGCATAFFARIRLALEGRRTPENCSALNCSAEALSIAVSGEPGFFLQLWRRSVKPLLETASG